MKEYKRPIVKLIVLGGMDVLTISGPSNDGNDIDNPIPDDFSRYNFN